MRHIHIEKYPTLLVETALDSNDKVRELDVKCYESESRTQFLPNDIMVAVKTGDMVSGKYETHSLHDILQEWVLLKREQN